MSKLKIEAGDGWPEGRKIVQRPGGVINMYWVVFDESQRGLESLGDDDSLYGVDGIEEESLALI